jgi:L-fuconolactonase
MTAEPIFDAHVHIWGDDRKAYPQVPGLAKPESVKGSVDWLVEEMDANGVLGALLVQVPWYGEDNRYLIDSRRRFPGRFAALGYLPDPLAPDAAERLARQFATEGLRGVRIHLDRPSIVAGLQEGKADHLLRRARDLGVPVQFLNRVPAQHEVIQLVARRFPDIIFVNDHLGQPNLAEGYPYPTSRPFLACGALPNVYAKVSLHHQLSSEAYPWRDLHDWQKLTVAAYGARRLMWGSNYPMFMPTPPYLQRLDAVRLELPFLSQEEKEWILGKTALNIWRPE